MSGDMRRLGILSRTATKAAKLSRYDISDYLDNDVMIAAYLDLAFESGNLSRIATALGNVARARGMTKIAKATGLSSVGMLIARA